MQTVIRGACQLKVTRSRMAPGSSAGTGDRWTSRLPVEAVPPPYHLFRRGIEAGLLPYAAAYHWRSQSPAFTGPGFGRNLQVVAALSRFAADRGATIAQLAVAGVLATRPCRSPSPARTPHHLQESVGVLDLALSRDDLAEIDSIMAAAVPLGGPSAEGMT